MNENEFEKLSSDAKEAANEENGFTCADGSSVNENNSIEIKPEMPQPSQNYTPSAEDGFTRPAPAPEQTPAPRYEQGGYGYNQQVNQPVQPTGTYPAGQNGYRPAQPQTPPPAYNYYGNGYYQPPTQPSGMGQEQPVNTAPPSPPKKTGKIVAAVILGICVVVAVVGMAVGILSFDMLSGQDGNATDTEGTTLPSESVTPDSSGSVEESIDISPTEPAGTTVNSVYVAQKVRPSVVGVMTYYDGQLSGEGSGVLMSEKDGWTYIITCAHVISEKDVTLGVLMLDGTTYEAQKVAYDERTDIGVIKIEETGLPLAEFGDSSALQVGEPIYAIGNPGGSEYFGSITDGIVASIDRSIASTYTMTCIQHNAAINPGNSGGALVNSAGQVVGINSSKIASTEFEGMGFAVPISIAAPIVDSLITYGYVPNRPKLGIQYAHVSAYQLYSIVVSIKGLPQDSLVIADISADSSLADTEAQVGDLIIAVNGKDMDDTSVLLDLIETGSVGDTLTLTLCRINERTYKTTTFDVTITLVEDRGSVAQEDEPVEPTTSPYGDLEDYFDDFFGW